MLDIIRSLLDSDTPVLLSYDGSVKFCHSNTCNPYRFAEVENDLYLTDGDTDIIIPIKKIKDIENLEDGYYDIQLTDGSVLTVTEL